MRLYHFTPAKYAIAAIRNRRLKIARIKDLNDPFELLAQDLSDPNWRKTLLGVKTQASEVLGFLCFSRSWSNPIMWSHYADRHRGLALGFDVEESACQPIRYSNERPNTIQSYLTSGTDPTHDQLIQWLQTKFEGWRYEDEVRVVCSLKDAVAGGGLYFSPFSEDLLLREVIVGLSAAAETIDEIAQTTAFAGRDIEVTLAQLAAKSFHVVGSPK